MTDNLQTITAPDGRTLAFAQWGDPDGAPIFSIHGTPGCRLNRHPDNAKIAKTGARLITYDRAGYGASDRNRGRTVADCVPDVTAILDALAIDRFSVVGGSGGGPHSLAVAAALPDRVIRAASLVGVAPYDVLGEDWFIGMDPENVKEFGWALEGEDRLQAEVSREAETMLARLAVDPATILGDFELPEADRELMARPDIARVMAEAIPECVRSGVWGWVDDNLAMTKPWGFDLASIRVPTAVWWGAQDVLVPAGHGEWLAAHVPHALPRIDHSGGHQADPDTLINVLYPWLVDGTPWDE